MDRDDASRVIGVYAFAEPGQVFLYEDGCVVAGSEQLIRKYLGALAAASTVSMKVSKLRFGECFEGLSSGAVYAFDKPAYTRFYSLARRQGIDDLEGFRSDGDGGLDLMKIKFDRPA